MATLLPRDNLNEQVYETLRQRVLRRDPGPGAKLSLHELATELGVSRSPVHHALTRLVSEGLLSVKARRGYYVTPVTAATVGDGYDVRLALELHAAERTVGAVDDARLERFRALMEESEAALSPGGVGSANAAFHEFQIDLAGNRDALPRLPRAVGQPDDAGDPRRHARGRRVPRARAPRDRRRVRRRPTLPAAQQAIRTHIESGKGSRSTRSSAQAGCSRQVLEPACRL